MQIRNRLALAAALLLAACGGAAPTPTPTGSPGASPSPTPGAVSAVASAAQAAAVVFASDPRFAAMRPANTDLIGECCSYEAVDSPPGFQVTINIGWGDCEAGCISHHSWQFHVDTDGTVSLVGEQGDEGAPAPPPGAGTATVTLNMRAGPTCPVVRNPPDPACAPRPVVNAMATLRDPSGAELATGTSDEAGHIVLNLPAGAYYVEPQPADGLMGQAAAVAFSVVGGETVAINLDYDTGIR